MPLSDSALSQLIQANMGQLGSDSKEVNQQYQDGIKKLADAIASAVVTHITSNAQVNIAPSSISVTGMGNSGAPVVSTNVAVVTGTIL